MVLTSAVFWKILHGLQSLGLVKVPVAKPVGDLDAP